MKKAAISNQYRRSQQSPNQFDHVSTELYSIGHFAAKILTYLTDYQVVIIFSLLFL